MADEASPRLSPRATYHHGDLRARLIDAVRELVETHGPDSFSVAEAARRAGVSSAAPYKHFKDRTEILRGVVGEAMDRLHSAMQAGADRHPAGSLEAVAAVGLAYVHFARAEPGVFRLVFSLTEGHEKAAELVAKGEGCFDVVQRVVGACLGREPEDPEVQRRAYMLWCFVHGHSFLILDMKHKVVDPGMEDLDYLMSISRALFDPAATA